MRGTGKTTKLLKATPAGGIFIVQNKQMIQYIQHWLAANGREDDEIEVVSVTDLKKVIHGRQPITIDHCVQETMSLCTTDQKTDLVWVCLNAPLTITCDDEGDIRTVWNQR